MLKINQIKKHYRDLILKAQEELSIIFDGFDKFSLTDNNNFIYIPAYYKKHGYWLIFYNGQFIKKQLWETLKA